MGEDRFYLIDCMDPDDEYAVDEEVFEYVGRLWLSYLGTQSPTQ